MSETLYYLDDFTDEVMPCAPTLEAWAEWLSRPDEEYGRADPVADGSVFAGSTLVVLGEVCAQLVDGAWQAQGPIPEGTDQFFLRHFGGSPGWNAEFAGETIEDALDCYDDEGPTFLACVRSGENFHVRFEAAGPRCVIVRPS
jgi:hypothetical protein